MINYNGLNDEEVLDSRKKYGNNELTKVKKKTFFKILISSLGDPIIKILLIALCIKVLFIFSKYDWYETIGIAVAVMLASMISTLSEYGSEEAFKRLQDEASKIKVKVLRNNTLVEVEINEIVVGDIVNISSGDSIPADGILINGSISCNESALTGESKDIKKINNSKLYRGSVVTNGNGKMIVKAVGNNTEYGKISLEIQQDDPPSTLKLRLYGLAKIISKIGYIGAFVVSLSYLFNKIVIANNFNLDLIIATISTPKIILNYLIYALTLSVTIIIVAVPEGLPMMITLVLSSNMKRMLKDNVLVRKPTGIETSGNINYLLTDKTGTLTKGILEVTNYISGDLKTYKKEEELKRTKIFETIYDAIIMNNESIISKGNVIGGNSTDKALIQFLKPKKENKTITKRIPFDSEIKYSAIYLNDTIYLKGASEVIIPKCSKYLNTLGEEKIILNNKLIFREIDKYTKKGFRVITLAKGNNLNNNLTFLGFITLKDELRKEAKEGIDLIKKAGINIIMITGDAKDTAKNIAKDCGIIDNDKDLILTSDELNKMDEEDIKKVIHRLKVVARAYPKDKSRLVSILESMNYVVGMTGDGVNDAPALKKANVGFAMGSGTEVAKEASDIVILDNNILSISKAILYGRTIFKSIRRFVTYQLTVNMTALFLSIIGSYIGVSTPITIIQMLWLNMIMDTFSGLAFSYEAPLKYYMAQLPKKKDEPIINKYMYSQIIINSIYSALICILFLKLPIIKEFIRSDYKHFMTSYFALFIFIGIFNAFNARTERLNILSNIFKNKVFIIIFSFITIAQIFLIYNGHELFRTYGMTLFELIFVIIIAFSVIPIDFIRKLIIKRNGIKIEI